MDQKTLKQFALLVLILVGYLLVYFFYRGISTTPWEGDSLAYHIPIAQDLLNGRLLSPSTDYFGLLYYPGGAETILAAFLLFHIPLNLFNLLSWSLLFFLCLKLGERFGVPRYLAILFAASIVALPSIIRLIPTQTSDIWLAVFFTWSLYLLQKPQKALKYFFILGLAFGLLIGTKVSGILYATVLFAFYFRQFAQAFSLPRFIAFIIPFILTGFLWYIRNFVVTGNPIYPGHIFGLPGNPNFHLQDEQPWKMLFFTPNGILKIAEAFNSEFLLWSIGILVVLGSGIYFLVQKRRLDRTVLMLAGIGAINLLIYFFLPSWPENLLSDLRYTYPAFIPLILVLFLLGREKRFVRLLISFSVLQIAIIFSYIPFYPKLVLIYFIFISILYILRKRLPFVL